MDKNIISIPENTDLNIPINQKSKWAAVLESIIIKPHEEATQAQTIIQIVQEDETIDLLGLGDFSVIIGKAKSRKTFFVSMLVAAFLDRDRTLYDSIRPRLYNGKLKIVYFDTEQSRSDVIRVKNRIKKLLPHFSENYLEVYPLRKYNCKERLEIIEERLKDCTDVGMVVVDGARDLVSSINCEEQATEISGKFLKWTEEKNIHLITVLHQNKGDNNARGHLGTELVNKAQTVLSVTVESTNNKVSVVEAEFCRYMPPNPMAFEIDDRKLPQFINDYRPKTKATSTNDINQLQPHECYSFFNELFAYNSKEEGIGHGELKELIVELYEKKYNKRPGGNKVVSFITTCKESGYITQEKKMAPYFLGKYDSQPN
jgi:hypothetical protein